MREFRPDIIYERHSLLGVAGLYISRRLDVPLVLEVNAPLSKEQSAHRHLAFPEMARGLERVILCSADHVVTVSVELKRWLISGGVVPERVTVLPNAVDTGRFGAGTLQPDELRARLGLDGQPTVGFVGTLKPWHGTETLVRAVGALHRRGVSPHLLIVGDGPQRNVLEQMVAQERIAHATTFTGTVPHGAMPGYMAAMDIAVAPYPWSESFYFSPLKLFEYMAAGCPVVAADTGQIRECLRNGETGLLYQPGDVDALADALSQLLADPVRAGTIGRAGQEYVRAHHTWEGNAHAVVELSRALVHPRGGDS
ncbi:MAG: glycosyltransferase family 4 protein [Chloroflexota bacterium]|nr:glycosyltransferase family 4 protein [Chloroflexota bacterium]